MTAISPERLQTHLRYLCEEIGVRLAGTPADKKAADYCAQQLEAGGAAVSMESFPVMSRVVTDEELAVNLGGNWEVFPCSLFVNTPGTDGATIEAPLVFFEAPAEYERADLSHLRGKAVVHLGCHIESHDAYRRLMTAEPAFLLFVDIRFPGTVPLTDAMFPTYTNALGARPTINVAYMDAWRWRQEGADTARLTVSGGMEAAESRNVVGELLGTDPDAGMIYLGAHHDTQADSVGADDNASGVAGIIELARILSPRRRRRTVRLVSFGAEEQLSVGSACYVREHREELAQAQLIFNLDSYGSWLGWNELIINGPTALRGHIGPFFERKGFFVRITDEIMPYADHFPFVAAGVPGITLIRMNCASGRFFHHRSDDDLSRVSAEMIARNLDAIAALIADLAQAPKLPFARNIPVSQAKHVEHFWVDLFGGWAH